MQSLYCRLYHILKEDIMTLQEFKNYRAITAKTLDYNLKAAKEHGDITKAHKSILVDTYKKVEMLQSAKPQEVAGKLAYIAKHITNGGKCDISPITKTNYCIKSYIGTRYTLTIPTIPDEVEETAVPRIMKKFVLDKIKLDANNEWLSLDCKVMELYKQGKIDWADVVKSHVSPCDVIPF